ncbi:HdeD family acid-resistance protein [Actinomadura sp. NTSP31]|uniref:HdeD family acid-resistance protein n=1 Tax=Actinomadura sp. NTSP31 TaxID=1735447 RepID=UPI0035C0C7EE
MTSATSPQAAGQVAPPDDKLMMRLGANAWGFAVAAGLASLGLGLAIVAWPDATIKVVAILFGLKLIGHGVYRIVLAVTAGEGTSARVLFTLLGVFSIAVGVIVLRHQFQTVTALALLFGLFWLIAGIVELVTAVSDRGLRGRGPQAAAGGLSIAAGLVMLLYPEITLTALTWLLGLWLITWGLLTAGVALWIRHAVRRQASPGR